MWFAQLRPWDPLKVRNTTFVRGVLLFLSLKHDQQWLMAHDGTMDFKCDLLEHVAFRGHFQGSIHETQCARPSYGDDLDWRRVDSRTLQPGAFGLRAWRVLQLLVISTPWEFSLPLHIYANIKYTIYGPEMNKSNTLQYSQCYFINLPMLTRFGLYWQYYHIFVLLLKASSPLFLVGGNPRICCFKWFEHSLCWSRSPVFVELSFFFVCSSLSSFTRKNPVATIKYAQRKSIH